MKAPHAGRVESDAKSHPSVTCAFEDEDEDEDEDPAANHAAADDVDNPWSSSSSSSSGVSSRSEGFGSDSSGIGGSTE